MNDRVPYKPDVETPVNNPNTEPNRISGNSYLDDTNYHRMAKFLGVGIYEREDPKMAQKISELSDWAATKSGRNDELSRMKTIKQLIRDMGVTYKGKELIGELWRFASLDTNKMIIEEEMEMYRVKPSEPPKPKIITITKTKDKDKPKEEIKPQPQQPQYIVDIPTFLNTINNGEPTYR